MKIYKCDICGAEVIENKVGRPAKKRRWCEQCHKAEDRRQKVTQYMGGE